MRIVFAGTSNFSSQHLSFILDGGWEVGAVLSQPDKGAGRGKRIVPTATKTLAKAFNIRVLQPSFLRKNELIEKEIKKINPDLILVVSYGLMVPKNILSIPRLGCINVHASLLPRWRGAAPIERCILSGDKKSGITIMKMNEGLDSGPILKKYPCDISLNETAQSLEKKLLKISKTKISSFLSQIDRGLTKEKKQEESLATFAPKVNKEETEIYWDKESSGDVIRKIRAFNPRFGTFSFIGKKRIKILKASMGKNNMGLSPGYLNVTSSNKMEVGCNKETTLILERVQLENKRSCKIEDFIRGNLALISKEKKFST